jgi:hypothetical protein
MTAHQTKPLLFQLYHKTRTFDSNTQTARSKNTRTAELTFHVQDKEKSPKINTWKTEDVKITRLTLRENWTLELQKPNDEQRQHHWASAFTTTCLVQLT